MRAVEEWRNDPEVLWAAHLALEQRKKDAAEVVRLLNEAGAIISKMYDGPLGRHDHDLLYEARWQAAAISRSFKHLVGRTVTEHHIHNVAAFNGDRLLPEKGWPPPKDYDDHS